jgi:hypothetical protein
MKLLIDLGPRPPPAIDSFAKHYNEAQNLMPHDPINLDNVMPLSDRPWYRRAFTWLLVRLGVYE